MSLWQTPQYMISISTSEGSGCRRSMAIGPSGAVGLDAA
jgi:hypothetical protein